MIASMIIAASRSQALPKLLESIRQLDFDPASFEVIIVKNPDILVPALVDKGLIIDIPENHASIKRNKGVERATSRYLCFIDDDVVVPPGWLREGIRFLEEHSTYAGVSGREYSLQKGLGHRLSNAILHSSLGNGCEGHSCQKFKEALFYENVLCNCIIHRTVWDAIGGLNAVADYHADDTEFFFIAYEKGYRLAKWPGLQVCHEKSPFGEDFFKKIYDNAVWTGVHTLVFPEIYLRILPVRLMLLGLALVPFLLVSPAWIGAGLLFYSLIVLGAHLKLLLVDRPLFFSILPGFLCHHLLSFIGFATGMIKYFFFYHRWKTVREAQKVRYAGFDRGGAIIT